MFGTLKRKIVASFLWSFLKSLATDKNTQTTVAGWLAGTVIAIKGINPDQLLAGDPAQLGVLLSSIAVAAMGQLATKENRNGHTTVVGVIAGVTQLYIGDFTNALVIALCGYFTNQPTTAKPAKAEKA